MQFPEGGLKRALVFFGACFFTIVSQHDVADAARLQDEPMHWSADRTIWDRRNNRVELFGNAVLNKKGQSLQADYILLDLKNRKVDAKGNCIYSASDTSIYSREIHFSLDTSAGSIVEGKVTNGSFLLVGERINKLGQGHFQTHFAEYTTCRDCPSSWSFQGEDVELKFEGYAYMSNVIAKVKDTPVFWIPYMILPVKTERQTGFLFPRLSLSGNHGFVYVQPFFWAVSRSSDMTVGLGTYSERGQRLEWQGRYALSDKSKATADLWYTRDSKTDSPRTARWGVRIEQSQELPFGIFQKLRLVDVSDNQYHIDFNEDISARGEPVLASDLIFTGPTVSDVSSYVAFRRYRNLLNFNEPTKFDPNTVQLLPRAELTTNDQFLFGAPVAAGVTVGVSNFTRSAGAFDYDPESAIGSTFVPGTDPIRKATRVHVTPGVYTTLRPFDVFNVVPSLEYRGYFYSFQQALPNLSRGYLLFETEFNFQFEKVYETDDEEVPRVKHLVRPMLRYSRIPFEFKADPNHPFLTQINNRSGYNFDNNDIVPFSLPPSLENYFTPQGASITYGLTTQLVRKRITGYKDDQAIPDAEAKSYYNAQYENVAEFSTGQTLNFLELEKDPGEAVPLSRLFANLKFNYDRFVSNTQYFFYPFLGRLLPEVPFNQRSPHEVSSSLTYIIERGLHQKFLEFDRSISLGYTWSRLSSRTSNASARLSYSINDYILPSVGASFDFISRKFLSADTKLVFQDRSKCWKLDFSLARNIETEGVSFGVNFALNFSGGGFGNFGNIAEELGGAQQ